MFCRPLLVVMLAIALSVNQLTPLVSCLVSSLFCRSMKIPNRITKLSIDGPTKQWRYQTGYQSCQLMDRQNNEDTKQDNKAVNWWTDKTSRSINWQHLYPVWYLHCFVGLSIDSFVILFGIFIVLSIHQLTTLVFCLVSLLFCRFINWQLWYSVWYLYCFVGSSIDSFGILFGIFIVLSVHQLTALVSCLVSLLFCRSINWQLCYPVWYLLLKLSIDGPTKQWRYQTGYQSCQLMNRQNNEDTKQDTKVVKWWTDKTMKIPNRIPKVSIDEPTKQ
jgi:hypothetical protein